MEEKGVELADYINVLWRKKWIIIIGTLTFMILAGIFSLIIKPVYEIDTIIQPGKFVVENQSGSFEEVVIEEPQQIAFKINQKSYNELIAGELNVELEELPDINAENINDTLLTKVWIRNHDVDLGKKILQLIIFYVKKEMDKKIGVEIYNIETEIKKNEIEMERARENLKILREKLKIINQRKKEIQKELGSVNNKISELEQERLNVLKREKFGETESLGLLLYSNEIQQSLRYYNTLSKELRDEKIEEENINSNLVDENALISRLENEIKNLNEKKGRLDLTKVIKSPTRSLNPVFPKKTTNVLVAGVLGFLIFLFIAFIINYIEEKKETKI